MDQQYKEMIERYGVPGAIIVAILAIYFTFLNNLITNLIAEAISENSNTGFWIAIAAALLLNVGLIFALVNQGRKSTREISTLKTQLEVKTKEHTQLTQEQQRNSLNAEENFNHLMALYTRWEDIDEHTGLIEYHTRLQSSPYMPLQIMPEVHRSLRFMGHGGSKWASSEEALKCFTQMLERISDSSKKARLLLLHPDSRVCEVVSTRRFGNPLTLKRKLLMSLMQFKELETRFRDCFCIRLYEHQPQLRLVFMDDRKLAVGHYKAYMGDSIDTPILAFEPNNPWSFYKAYEGLFEDEWDKAHDIDWVELDVLLSKMP